MENAENKAAQVSGRRRKTGIVQEELPWDSPLDRAYSVPALSVRNAIPLNRAQLPSEDALRVKSAEFWLRLGEVDEALRELRELHCVIDSWQHPGYTRAHGHALLRR